MTLIEALQTIPDHRRGAGQRYPLWVFLLLIILGTMSGYRGYRGLSRFMKRHQAELAAYFQLKRQQLPSYSTIRRMLNEIDFDAVAAAFSQWAVSTGLVQTGDDCAIDGKGLSNTVTNAHDAQQNFVNVVSVFQLQQGLVVGQAVFDNHQQSEIEVVYQLLERLQLKGVTVSMDALHAQKKTVELLHTQGNDYVISVKANQRKLYAQLQQSAQAEQWCQVDIDSESTRGRKTTRIASVFALPQWVKAMWQGAQQGVEVTRISERQGRAYCERHYYISSWQGDAKAQQQRVRAHWGIENPLHWVKDVVLGEDHSSIDQRPAATLMALTRNLVITLFRRAGHRSITEAIDYYSNDLAHLLPMVGLSPG